MAIRAKYVGDGQYFQGIPARDLTQEEYEALSTEQRADLRASPIYEVLTDREYADLVRVGRRKKGSADETTEASEPAPTEEPAEAQPAAESAEVMDDGSHAGR